MNHKAMPFTSYPWCGAMGSVVQKWSETDCLVCLQQGRDGGNQTATTRLAKLQATDRDSLPNRIAEVDGPQRGFKGSEQYGRDEYWDD